MNTSIYSARWRAFHRDNRPSGGADGHGGAPVAEVCDAVLEFTDTD